MNIQTAAIEGAIIAANRAVTPELVNHVFGRLMRFPSFSNGVATELEIQHLAGRELGILEAEERKGVKSPHAGDTVEDRTKAWLDSRNIDWRAMRSTKLLSYIGEYKKRFGDDKPAANSNNVPLSAMPMNFASLSPTEKLRAANNANGLGAKALAEYNAIKANSAGLKGAARLNVDKRLSGLARLLQMHGVTAP